VADVPFFTDNFKITPGALGSVHNPQLKPSGWPNWEDPFSVPLTAVVSVGATYVGSFISNAQSELDPRGGSSFTPYAIPNGMNMVVNMIGPDFGSADINFITYFHADVALQQRAAIAVRFTTGGFQTSVTIIFGAQNVTPTTVTFSVPDSGIAPPRAQLIRMEIDPAGTALRLYVNGTLRRNQIADFSWALSGGVCGFWLLFNNMANNAATKYLVGDLELSYTATDPPVEYDLVVQEALHAQKADTLGSVKSRAFPDGLPCVSRIDGYAMEASAAVIRTAFDAGNTRQRRANTDMRMKIQLAWRVNNTQLQPLFAWLNQYGFDWFTIELSGVESSAAHVFKSLTEIRLISDINVSLMRVHRQNWYILSCIAEYAPPINMVPDVDVPPLLLDVLTVDRDPTGTIADRDPDITTNDFYWRASGDTTLSIVDGIGAAATGTSQDLIQFLTGAPLDSSFVPLGIDGEFPWYVQIKMERRARSPGGGNDELMELRLFLDEDGANYLVITWTPETVGITIALVGDDEDSMTMAVGTVAQGLGVLTLNITVDTAGVTVDAAYTGGPTILSDALVIDMSAFGELFGARVEALSGDSELLWLQRIEVSTSPPWE